jgi:hypothetical protein
MPSPRVIRFSHLDASACHTETAVAAERFRSVRAAECRLRAAPLTLAVVSLAVLEPAAAQLAEPLQVRNLNPLVAVFGLPSWDTVSPGNRFATTFEVANHYRFSQRGAEVLVLDGETVRTDFAFSRGFGDGWSVGVDVPYLRVGGGVLDDLIDGWHSAFRLPDGGRNVRPEGELLYVLGDAGGAFYRLTEPRSGVGDLQLKVARTLGPKRGFVLQAAVKAPTGDEALLAGSGSADWSVTLLRTESLPGRRRPAGYYWGVGLVRAGEPEAIDYDAEKWVYVGLLGGSWQPWPRFGLKAQIDYHGPFIDSPLEEIGEGAIQATFGAWMKRTERASLEFAIVEDLEVSTAPDVVVQVAARWLW